MSAGRPWVRSPRDPCRGTVVVSQRTGTRGCRPPGHFVDLRFDEPLHAEPALVRKRFGIERRRRVAGVNTAGDEYLPEVWIADLERASDLPHLSLELIRIR